ncbi:hypothetical protein E4N62_43625 [Streptomyces sp. MNU76]|uniref:hypothetical protein n=1 Tax=Streptomyces sp. MNU76 TaxID=2560026 RepID=UPI001E3D7985|nr:hypothetical protein [Streptomyces sp. MNU76]MCC9711511.1 hypothetical protein [Streptomyces sp. MNU76]
MIAPPRRSCCGKSPTPTTSWSWSGPTAATPAASSSTAWPRSLVLAIVKRSDDMRGFVVLPKRWIVERVRREALVEWR